MLGLLARRGRAEGVRLLAKRGAVGSRRGFRGRSRYGPNDFARGAPHGRRDSDRSKNSSRAQAPGCHRGPSGKASPGKSFGQSVEGHLVHAFPPSIARMAQPATLVTARACRRRDRRPRRRRHGSGTPIASWQR
jgi:hypothetical protein